MRVLCAILAGASMFAALACCLRPDTRDFAGVLSGLMVLFLAGALCEWR